MKKFKCKYCNKEITFGNIRCINCDKIWQEGFRAGYKDMKQRINETLKTLFKLGEII